jgi:L-threonylcarbamoyladenylate synthase
MKILQLGDDNLEKIKEITAKAVKDGQVLICPTDTVYGLICDATNESAVEKIFEIKNRPKNKPLPIFVKDIKMAKEFAEINEEQEKFLKKVWPGNTTAVLTKKKNAPKLFGTDERTVGIRIPKYQFILDLIKELGVPLAETSVNISGQAPMTNIKEIIEKFGKNQDQPDLLIDAGDLGQVKPSQVIDLTSEKPKIIRE